MIRFANPLVLVDDIDRSAAFYTSLLGLEIVEHHPNFVLFNDHFAIHDGDDLLRAAGRARVNPAQPWGRDSVVLYFEANDPQRLYDRLVDKAEVLHPPRIEQWGQTVFRILDPDGHLIEIGSSQVYPPEQLEPSTFDPT